MGITETIATQYQRIATAAATVSAQYPAMAAYADRAYVDLSTTREIGTGEDEAAFKPAFRHANHIAAACNEASTASNDTDARKVLGALDVAASLWVTALNHHLSGKNEHAEYTLTQVDTALAHFDLLAAAGQR
jgi:enolase